MLFYAPCRYWVKRESLLNCEKEIKYLRERQIILQRVDVRPI